MIGLRRLQLGQRVGDDEGLEAGQRIEGNLRDEVLGQFLDVHAALMGQRHGGGAKAGRIGDREIDLVLGRHRAFEGNAVGFGDDVTGAVLDEI